MECPMCGGEGTELGGLGFRMHYRCRDCGMDYSVDTRSKLTVPEKHQKKIEVQNAKMPKAMRAVMSSEAVAIALQKSGYPESEHLDPSDIAPQELLNFVKGRK